MIRFRSAADATKAMASTSQILKSFPEGIQLSAVPGPGEQALWGAAAEEGAIWVVRKGATMFTVMFVGEHKKPQSLREPLRKLAASGLAKLP